MWACNFDVDSSTFLCDIGTLMWLSGTLVLAISALSFWPCIVSSRRFMLARWVLTDCSPTEVG